MESQNSPAPYPPHQGEHIIRVTSRELRILSMFSSSRLIITAIIIEGGGGGGLMGTKKSPQWMNPSSQGSHNG